MSALSEQQRVVQASMYTFIACEYGALIQEFDPRVQEGVWKLNHLLSAKAPGYADRSTLTSVGLDW